MEIIAMTETSRAKDAQARIAALRREHQALDDTVRAMEAQPSADQLQILRVKKRRLALRDQLLELEKQTRPNLIA